MSLPDSHWQKRVRRTPWVDGDGAEWTTVFQTPTSYPACQGDHKAQVGNESSDETAESKVLFLMDELLNEF